MPKTLQTQQVAPDFSFPNVWGGEVSLWEMLNTHHAILFFLRSTNNLPAQEHLSNLAKSYGEIESLSAGIILIMNEDLATAKAFALAHELPFAVLADPNNQVYDLYYLGRAYLVPSRTATLVVSREGVITYFKVAVNPWGWRHDDRELIEHIRGLNMRSKRA